MGPRYGGQVPGRAVRRGSERRGTAAAAEPLALGRRHRPDFWLVILCAILLAIGLMVVYAISPALSSANQVSSSYYVNKQLVAIGLSILVFLAVSQVPLAWWRQAAKPLLIFAAIATLIALVTPVNPAYPAHRWVRFAGLSFQSVEVVKFAALVALAAFLSQQAVRNKLADFRDTFKPLLIGVLIAGILIAGPQSLHAQSDLGSMGVIVAMVLIMAYVAGLPMKRLAMIGGILLIGVTLAILPSDYRRERLATYMNPEADCQNQGYQACQALIAVGSGGLVGQGLGSGAQAYGYLPEAANDSIFAIFGEKFGFIGSIALLGIFAALFSRMKTIIERTTDDFTRLLVVGVLAWLSVQAIINIGAMIGLLPLKGITLPFISYGGTSVVFIAAAMGLVFQASRYTTFSTPRVSASGGGLEQRRYRR